MEYKVYSYRPEDDALREKNLQTVIRYMELPGALMAERYKLFEESDECTTGLEYTATGKPMVAQGYEEVRKSTLVNAKFFSVWEWYNIHTYPTGDPNKFYVECDGKGISTISGKPLAHGDHYLHKFILRDGKILHYSEFMNPCNELLELGYELPNPQAGWADEQEKV